MILSTFILTYVFLIVLFNYNRFQQSRFQNVKTGIRCPNSNSHHSNYPEEDEIESSAPGGRFGDNKIERPVKMEKSYIDIPKLVKR